MSIVIANTEVSTAADLAKVATPDLLAFYNETTGKATKKFASRAKGEAQVWAVVEAKLAEQVPERDSSLPRKVRVKVARKVMKGDRPRETTADGKVLLELEQRGATTIAALAAALGRTERQVRNSISYLRRKYGVEIESINSQELQLG